MVVYGRGNEMTLHRDNGVLRRKKGGTSPSLTGHPGAGSKNSQIPGTCTMVVSIGSDMNFTWVSPRDGRIFDEDTGKLRGRKFYRNKENVVEKTVSLSHGSVYVWHPHDDERSLHQVKWDAEADEDSVRFALVYRWLEKKEYFYCGERYPTALRDAIAIHRPDGVDISGYRKYSFQGDENEKPEYPIKDN